MKASSKLKNNTAIDEVKVENEKDVAETTKPVKAAKSAKTTKAVKKAKDVKVTETTKKAKTKKTSKVVSKKKKEVEEPTFEERAFSSDKKKIKIKPETKVNFIPIVVGIVCVVLVIVVVATIKSGKIALMETKVVKAPETTATAVKTPENTTKAVEAMKVDESVAAIDTKDIEGILPYYDSDVYSEAAMYAYDKKDIEASIDDINKLQNSETYKDSATDGEKDILEINKCMINNYLDAYNENDVSAYNQVEKQSYFSDIVNGVYEKKGKYYHSDYIAVSLFANAVDKGYYYEVPTSFYKKVTIKKAAFDKMDIGDRGSVSLPIGENSKMVATEVTKKDAKTISYVDKDNNTCELKLESKTDVEYSLIYPESGGYVVVQYLQADVSIFKNARVGHGKTMEYIANNYLKYPNELNFEVYVPAKDIVNKNSTNNMLNGQWINSNKQIWDEKGFLVSLVFFEG